jgi:hypothetical protein
MNNEWLEIAWINFNKAILHGQVVTGTNKFGEPIKQSVDLILSADQANLIQGLNAKQGAEMFKLLRSFLP